MEASRLIATLFVAADRGDEEALEVAADQVRSVVTTRSVEDLPMRLLREALSHQCARLAQLALDTLLRCDGPVVSGVDPERDMLRDEVTRLVASKDSQLSQSATGVLEKLWRDSVPLAEVLVPLVQSRSAEVALRATTLLGVTRGDSNARREILARCCALVSSGDAVVCTSAMETLAGIAPKLPGEEVAWLLGQSADAVGTRFLATVNRTDDDVIMACAVRASGELVRSCGESGISLAITGGILSAVATRFRGFSEGGSPSGSLACVHALSAMCTVSRCLEELSAKFPDVLDVLCGAASLRKTFPTPTKVACCHGLANILASLCSGSQDLLQAVVLPRLEPSPVAVVDALVAASKQKRDDALSAACFHLLDGLCRTPWGLDAVVRSDGALKWIVEGQPVPQEGEGSQRRTWRFGVIESLASRLKDHFQESSKTLGDEWTQKVQRAHSRGPQFVSPTVTLSWQSR